MENDTRAQRPKNWFLRHKAWSAVLILFAVGLVTTAVENINEGTRSTSPASPTPSPAAVLPSSPPASTPTPDENQPKELRTAGEQGYLRLPGSTDPGQKIILTENKESYGQVTKALLAKDYIGLLEIPTAFSVSVGTKVQVIETSFSLTRVRILSAVEKGDEDKLLRSGWTTAEWVVDR